MQTIANASIWGLQCPNKNKIKKINRFVPRCGKQNHHCGCRCCDLFFVIAVVNLVMITLCPSPSLADSQSNDVNQTLDDIIWPPLEHHDIWNSLDAAHDSIEEQREVENQLSISNYNNNYNNDDLIDSDLVEMVHQPSDWWPSMAISIAGENATEDDTTTNIDSKLQGIEKTRQRNNDDFWSLSSNSATSPTVSSTIDSHRDQRVLSLFPSPVDGECLSSDGRRTGTCHNPYECRSRGGTAKGDCALGFGVCCIFVADCNATISNNITYLVSPNFPSYMSGNFTPCRIRVKLLSDEISQLRLDFQHFSLGQPNRRTGVCDGDTFNISGGPGGAFILCGQNNGQHIYYDVVGRALPRQAIYASLRPFTYSQLYPHLNNNSSSNGTSPSTEEPIIEILLNFSQRFLPIRLWEIRIAQIPFSQRAPAGCLQYYNGINGVLQTFNFAENGRHLANQRYRICIRQEMGMCSILYEPCDEQSFRIGPMRRMTMPGGAGMMMPPGMMSPGMMPPGMIPPGMMPPGMMMPGMMMPTIAATASPPMNTGMSMLDTRSSTMATPTTPMNMAGNMSVMMTMMNATNAAMNMTGAAADPSTTAAPPVTMMMMMMMMTSTTTAAPALSDDPVETSPAAAEATTAASTTAATTSTTTTTTPPSVLSDDVEGSGSDYYNDDDDTGSPPARPGIPGGGGAAQRPAGGGFDLLGFLRSAFSFRGFGRDASRNSHRKAKQFYTTCNDRITMPCIIEDFIGTGLGPLPGCEPVHCGSQFCSSGVWPCRIESTVTPFYIGVNFGNGLDKGSAEDNIGMCLRYTQVECV